MTVSAELPSAMMEGAVKGAGFLKVSDRLCPSWVDGAVLKINGSDFVLDAKPSGSKASFTGKRMDAESYDIFYSASGMSREAVASMDFSKQKQTGNDNPGHLDYYALLSGVNDCEEVFFSPEWATAHGGTLKQSGCLKVKVLLPEGIESLSRISLGCEEKIFHSSNSGDSACSEISIELENVKAGSDGCITVYIATPWFPISFSDKDKLVFTGIDNDGNTVSKSFKPEVQTLYGNRVNEFVVGGNWPTQYKQGRGSMNDPYIISTAEEMKSIGNLLENDVITCFKLAGDIDMSGISGWTPINPFNSARGIYFDGNGKTVSNFNAGSGTWSSMFGVLHGTVCNLTLKDPVLSCGASSPCGILCAWAGNNTGTLEATVENVHIVGGKAEYTGTSATVFGGMCGNACNATFKNCSYEGTVSRSGKCTDVDNYVGTGGLIGKTLGNVKMLGCHVSGTVYCAAGRATGGLVGYWSVAAGEGDMDSCWTDATVTSVNDCTGGLVGWFAGGVFRNNWAENASVDCGLKASGTYSYCGGLIGHSSTSIDLSDCHFAGSIKGKGTIIGGVIGQATNGIRIQRCWFDGSITGGSYIGGILSRTGNKEGYLLSDCYSRGSIDGTTYLGGLVADTYAGNTIRNCWSGCSVNGTYGLGGLIARASNASGSAVLMGGQNFNITVEGCIAWNNSISTKTSGGENPETHYPCAPVVGYTAEKNTLKNCWRRSDMYFNYFSKPDYNVLYDQDDVDADHPLYRKWTDKYYFSYNGKASSAGETVSATAKRIGWDESVWDLSGSEPRLR